jgi:hypothetical protein
VQRFLSGNRWLTIPADWLDALLTPRQWPRLADVGAETFTKMGRPDSTQITALLSLFTRIPGALTAQLRRLSPLYRRWDWWVRKNFWVLLWALTVIWRYRPKRAWIPQQEEKIDMVPPTARHRDFRAEVLRFPNTVTLAEASLPTDLAVELIHLLQDLYPIIVPYQLPGATDPQRRLDEAYPPLFRWIKQSPRWHPELADAAASGNLLGALAVGGPFAKLLERVEKNSSEAGAQYVIDLSHMTKYAVRAGLARLGCTIHYVATDGKLRVTNITYNGETTAPGAAQWDFFERIALASLVTHVTVWRQGMEYHASGFAAFPAPTLRLPPNHPIRRLLTPHMIDTVSTSYHTHLTLRRNGFDVTGFAFPLDSLFEYYNDGARAFDIAKLDVRQEAVRRGIDESLDHPYQTLATKYYDLFEKYVTAYVELYYPDEATLQRDAALNAWFDALDHTLQNGIRHYVPTLTRENLVKLCTVIIYSVVIAHEENSLWDYALYMGTIVHADGSPMTVGEVQCVSNFQLLICGATNQLLQDFSYLALDERGKDCMRNLQRDLLFLQQELNAAGDRYWRLDPVDLKSSVAT